MSAADMFPTSLALDEELNVCLVPSHRKTTPFQKGAQNKKCTAAKAVQASATTHATKTCQVKLRAEQTTQQTQTNPVVILDLEDDLMDMEMDSDLREIQLPENPNKVPLDSPEDQSPESHMTPPETSLDVEFTERTISPSTTSFISATKRNKKRLTTKVQKVKMTKDQNTQTKFALEDQQNLIKQLSNELREMKSKDKEQTHAIEELRQIRVVRVICNEQPSMDVEKELLLEQLHTRMQEIEQLENSRELQKQSLERMAKTNEQLHLELKLVKSRLEDSSTGVITLYPELTPPVVSQLKNELLIMKMKLANQDKKLRHFTEKYTRTQLKQNKRAKTTTTTSSTPLMSTVTFLPNKDVEQEQNIRLVHILRNQILMAPTSSTTGTTDTPTTSNSDLSKTVPGP